MLRAFQPCRPSKPAVANSFTHTHTACQALRIAYACYTRQDKHQQASSAHAFSGTSYTRGGHAHASSKKQATRGRHAHAYICMIFDDFSKNEDF